MKKRLLFLVFLLSVATVAAEEVFDGAVVSGQTLNFDEDHLRFTVDPDLDKVFVDIDGSAMILDLFDCKSKNLYQICTRNKTFSFKNATTLQLIYEVDVTVNSLASSLSVSPSIELSDLLLEESSTGFTTIANTGSGTASNIDVQMHLPPQLAISNVQECKRTSYGMQWVGSLDKGQEKRCLFTIAGKAPGTYTLYTNSTFNTGAKNVEISSAIAGTVYNQSINMVHLSQNKTFAFDTDTVLTFLVENINGFDVTIKKVELEVPEGLLIRNKGSFQRVDQKLTWDGSFAGSEKTNLTVTLNSPQTALYEMPYTLEYDIKELNKKITGLFSLNASCDCPYLHHELVSVDAETVWLRMYLINPSETRSFTQVSYEYSSANEVIGADEKVVEGIAPLQSIRVINKKVPLATIQNAELVASATYKAPTQRFVENYREVLAEVQIVEVPTVVEEETVVEETPEAEEKAPIEEAVEQAKQFTLPKVEIEQDQAILFIVIGALVLASMLLGLYLFKSRH